MNEPRDERPVDIAETKLRFSAVAEAIDSTPTALRRWLESGRVKLDSDADQGWRSFSVRDVARLAIMRKLVNFGMSVEGAAESTRTVIPIASSGRYTLQDFFANRLWLVSCSTSPEGVRSWSVRPSHQARLASSLARTRAKHIARAWRDENDAGYDAVLILDLGKIVGRAFDRVLGEDEVPDELDETDAGPH